MPKYPNDGPLHITVEDARGEFDVPPGKVLDTDGVEIVFLDLDDEAAAPKKRKTRKKADAADETTDEE